MASILEQIGGEPAVCAAVDGLYERLLADASLAPYFTDADLERLKGQMRAFMTVALGGEDRDAGREMHRAHAHLGITNDAFDRVVVHLVGALASLGVRGETVAAIGAKVAPLRADIVPVEEEREAA